MLNLRIVAEGYRRFSSTMGFAQVGQTEKTSAIVMLSSAVRADRVLSTNEQIINFFILLSADGSGRRKF
jgi:hypothetical protein